MFYNKKEGGIIWIGLLITIVSISIIYLLNNPFVNIFAGLFTLLGGIFILSSGYTSETILPKLFSCTYFIIIERWLLYIFFSEKTKDSYWFFHIIFFFIILIIYFIFKYLNHIIYILKNKKIKYKEFELVSLFKFPYILITVLWLCFGKWTINRIEMGFQNPHQIAKKLYNDSSYEVRIGAFCRDGWESYAIGSGACSYHGGVAEWKTKKVFKKPYKQCYKEALEISWIE